MPRITWAGSPGITMRTPKITTETREIVKRRIRRRLSKKAIMKDFQDLSQSPLPWCLPARSRFGEGRGEDSGEGGSRPDESPPPSPSPVQGEGILWERFN